MRDIKFRAWHRRGKMYAINEFRFVDNKLRYVSLYISDKESLLIHMYDEPIILMQYTGLKDKNGKEVYEGDIVSADCNSPREPYIMTVVYGGAYGYSGFGITAPRPRGTSGSDPMWDTLSPGYGEDIEVIGNIYENPGLAKTL